VNPVPALERILMIGDCHRLVLRCEWLISSDHLLVESTGISEPLPVAAAFVFEDESGWSLSDVAELDTMVTFVDAVNFLEDLEQGEDLRSQTQTAPARSSLTVHGRRSLSWCVG